MTFRGKKLSDPSVRDVLLADVSDADYLYFVDDETGVTFRIRIGVLRAAIGGGGGGVSDATRRLSDADGVVDAGERLFSTLPTDYGRDIWIEPGVAVEQRVLQLPGNAALGTVLRIRYGSTLENGATVLDLGGNTDADGVNLVITPAGVYGGLSEGYVITIVHAERILDDGDWVHAWWILSETYADVAGELVAINAELAAHEVRLDGLDFAPAPAVHTAATLTLTDDHRNSVLRVSSALNAVAIRIPEAITGGEVGDATAFETAILVTDLTHAVTIATGVGLLTPEEHYGPELITEVNTWVCIKVLRGKAYVAIVPPGVDAVESAPHVQGVHTSATRLIVPSDCGQILRFSSALNAQAIEVLPSLFGSQGAGRAFSFTGKVENIANPITLDLDAFTTIEYGGPRNTLTTAGDKFVVTVVSATEVWVFIAAKL